MNDKRNRLTAIAMMVILAFGLTTCKKETVAPPSVRFFFDDGQPSSVNTTSASVSAEVTDPGGAEVKSRGFAYGVSGGSLDTIFCGSGTGAFSAELTNLQPNTTYVYEAFAKNAGGTGTSGKVTFATRDNEKPTVKTGEVEDVGTTSATCGGNVTNDGGAEVTERGVCWNTSHNPSINESHASAGSGLGEYSCNLTELLVNTTYYVRAYAKNSKGTAYGEEKQFVTQDYDLPEVTTANVTNITQTTAKSGGEVTSDGGTPVTERGICWSSSHTPTINNHKTPAGEGTGFFTAEMTGLSANTTYYVRAYAINSKGPNYGEEMPFTTGANPPTVSTGSVTNITTSSATGSGNVISDGGSPVWERGLCWSTNHKPTINGTHLEAGEGTGEFNVTMTNLSANTTYYVRAYAINGVEPAYGAEVEFETPSQSVPSVTTASVTNIGQTSAIGGGNVISDGGADVTERGICWSTSHNPTINGSHKNSGIGLGEFTADMTHLTPDTIYYVRAYAINAQGLAYGGEVDFRTSQLPTYTVGVSANPLNGGSVTGGGTYQQGQRCNVKANANDEYTFVKWTENGTQVSDNPDHTFTVESDRNLVAHFQQRTYTISVSASPSGGGAPYVGNTPGTTSGTYTSEQSCTVRANPNSGYTFANWTVNGNIVSTEANYTFTVTNNRNLVAHYTANPQTYTISVSASPSNGGIVSGGGSYTLGQLCTVQASANSNFVFIHWTVNGAKVSNSPIYTFQVTGNRTLVAVFKQISPNNVCANAYPICIENGYEYSAGVNTGSGEVGPEYGCLNTQPNPVWFFFRMDEPGNMDISIFSSRNPDIDFCCWGPFADPISPCPNGLTENKIVSCSYSASDTEHCMIPATAQTGEYYFIVVTNYSNQPCSIHFNKEGGSGTSDCSFIVEPPSPTYYSISVSANPAASGSVSGGGTYQGGQNCTVHAYANNGYTFANWTENGSVVSYNANYSFTVTGNRSLVAHFNDRSCYACQYFPTNSNGYIQYPNDNPNNVTILNSNLYLLGGDYYNGYLYAYGYTNPDDTYYFYKINATTGAIVSSYYVGPTVYCSDCAYDYTTNRLYGCNGNDLYIINLSTGTQTYVGSFGINGVMLALFCNTSGQLYGVQGSGASDYGHFYHINKSTGTATMVSTLNYFVNYAQSGGFDRDSGILYWAGFVSDSRSSSVRPSSGLASSESRAEWYGIIATINPNTGSVTVHYTNTGEQCAWSLR